METNPSQTAVSEAQPNTLARIGNILQQGYENIRRNARTYAAIGATAFVGGQAAELAFNADMVDGQALAASNGNIGLADNVLVSSNRIGLADNIPAPSAETIVPGTADNRQAIPEAQASYVPTRPCGSVDSTSPYPQWHARYTFNTPDGKERIKSVRPGGLTRFVARVAGGNLEAFNMEVAINYNFPTKYMEILERGSHPTWSKSGGMPHWAIKELCHWQNKRKISFLLKVSDQTPLGRRLCLPIAVWGRTAGMDAYPTDPPVQYRCLKVE